MIKSARQRLRQRIGRLKLMVHFAWASGSSIKERARLFYYAEIHPSLAYRGWSKYAPERTISFSIRAPAGRLFRVHVRDNMHDSLTLAEFFSCQYTLIPPGQPPFEPKVVYDIGANIGIASLYFATRFPKARFFGFEPVPANHRVCAMNFKNLTGGECFPWAVGAKSGRANFDFNLADLRGGRLKGSSQLARAGLERIEVPVFSIADLVATERCPPPDFLKIDVEGAEVNVLCGLGGQVKNVNWILVETHGPSLEAGCREWCLAHGFEVLRVHQQEPGFGALWCRRFRMGTVSNESLVPQVVMKQAARSLI